MKTVLCLTTLSCVFVCIPPPCPAQEDVADVPSQDLLAGKDKDKRYFLIGPAKAAKAPRRGFALLVILPGGDGSAEFHPFVKRIWKNALPEGYLVAQPVAVKWSEDQNIVWPTSTNKVKGMKFTTEEFVEAVIDEVKGKLEVDPARVFTLSWSSSGPAAYALSLTGKKVAGSFVAMSVFNPKYLPDLEKAKGHAYYIYHSKEDRVCPYRMAVQAERDLKKAGANVQLVTYKGGHGWRGPLYDDIREGIVWLEKNGAKPAGARSFRGSAAGEEREIGGVKFCWCPPGKFTMGSPRSELERRPGEDQVEVTLTKGFWMAKYEATQGDWKRIIRKLPGEFTAELPEGDDLPVGNVNYSEIERYCRLLTALARYSGDLPKDWEVRLPTEAQWEYACRAGTTTATSFGDKLSSKQANFKGDKPYNGGENGPSLGKAVKVGSYPANPWSLHDMHGNTFEWCRDWYHAKLPGGIDPDLYSAKATAAQNRTGDYSRVRRGGAWTDPGWPCRSAFRLRFEPHRRYDHIGFRVVAVEP